MRAFCCAGILGSVSPVKKPNRITEVEVTICCWDLFGQPGLKLSSERDDQNIFVSQHSRKPSVACRYSIPFFFILHRMSVSPPSYPDPIYKDSWVGLKKFCIRSREFIINKPLRHSAFAGSDIVMVVSLRSEEVVDSSQMPSSIDGSFWIDWVIFAKINKKNHCTNLLF